MIPNAALLRRVSCTTVVLSLLVGTLFLAFRRVSGELSSISIAEYVFAFLALLGTSEVLQAGLIRRADLIERRRFEQICLGVLTCVIWAILVVLWNESIGIAVPLLLALLAGGQTARLWQKVRAERRPAQRLVQVPEIPQGTLTQEIRRTIRDDGTEAIIAVLSHNFQAGDRQHTFYVSFCPPTAALPQANVKQLAGPGASLTIADLKTYGVRIDSRLYSPTQERVLVTIEFSGTVAAS